MERARHCVRPGCGAPAAATLGYHYASRLVWIDSLDEHPIYGEQDLCSLHADRMVVPVGWALDDRRTPIIQLRSTIAG